MRPKSLLYPTLALLPLLALPCPARAQAVYTVAYSLGSATATQGGDTLTITAASGTTHNDPAGQPTEVLNFGDLTPDFPVPGSVTLSRAFAVTLAGPGIVGTLAGNGTASASYSSIGFNSLGGGGFAPLPGGWLVSLYTPSLTSRQPMSGSLQMTLTVQGPQAAPEPAAWLLWGVGAAGLGTLVVVRQGKKVRA